MNVLWHLFILCQLPVKEFVLKWPFEGMPFIWVPPINASNCSNVTVPTYKIWQPTRVNKPQNLRRHHTLASHCTISTCAIFLRKLLVEICNSNSSPHWSMFGPVQKISQSTNLSTRQDCFLENFTSSSTSIFEKSQQINDINYLSWTRNKLDMNMVNVLLFNFKRPYILVCQPRWWIRCSLQILKSL